MAMHHFSRLLRLARRTGDRIIVTDEHSNDEPLVILPLDEYEALVDGALGPGDDSGGETRMSGGGESWLEPDDIVEDIQIDDEEGGDMTIPVVPEVEVSEGVVSDEAEIDEEALKPLWEPIKSEENTEKHKETKKDVQKKPSDGEEGFYLESID